MIQYCPFSFCWQDSYNRGQEHPFFAGLLRGNESGSRSISRSTSDIGDFRSKNFSDISGKSKDLPIKDSVSDILEPFELGRFLHQPLSNSKVLNLIPALIQAVQMI